MDLGHSCDNNVGVALIFFARPDVLSETFKAIEILKPKKLFLIQDGPRNVEDDLKIRKCRKIVEKISWDCQVFENYSTINLGCGKRVHTGIDWAFQHVDKLVILEDDCVPSTSFLSFCTELLNKYETDLRIDMICGMNHLNIYNKSKYDYFFCSGGSIHGWATWKRVWEKIDYSMEFLDDDDAVRLLKKKYGRLLVKKGFQLREKLNQGRPLSSWSYQRGVNAYLNSGLSIVPRVNLIKNIGITEDSANSVASMKLIPRGLRPLYRLINHETPAVLNHPKYVIADCEYDRRVDWLMGNANRLQYYFRKSETAVYRLLVGDFKGVFKKIVELVKTS